MSASIIKYLKFEEYYTTTQIAKIVGVAESHVSRILNGRSNLKAKPSFEDMTEEMLERKHIIDKIIGLKHLYLISDYEQLGYYASLLRYLGFTKEELRLTFPNMGAAWVGLRFRSGEEWKKFDSTLIGISAEDYQKIW